MDELEQLENKIREQKLQDDYASALAELVAGENATVYDSAIEINWCQFDINGPELVMRLVAITDAQRLEIARKIIDP